MISPQNILIADDHPLFRDALRGVVSRVSPSATFVEAASHAELLAQTTIAGDAFDLIFIDLLMPGGDHFDELARLRERMPLTPTIVISSRADAQTIRRAMACGIAGYIPKSWSTVEMERAIRSVLAGDVSFPDETTPRRGERRPGEPEPLTPRQTAVLDALQQGHSNRQIAVDLGIEEVTVKVHISAILRKLHVKNRLQAIVVAREGFRAGD